MPNVSHPWDVTPEQARRIQENMRDLVVTQKQIGRIRSVAGVDAGFQDGGKTISAAIAVLTYPDLVLLEYAVTQIESHYPYIPGLLSFREIPAILRALKYIKNLPDLLILDGQGIAHPKRLGVASHMGILTGMPTIGVAKKDCAVHMDRFLLKKAGGHC